MVTPIGNALPELKLQTTEGAGSQLSVAEIELQVAMPVQSPGLVPIVISAGQTTDGGVLSVTVTKKLQLPEFPASSKAI